VKLATDWSNNMVGNLRRKNFS